MPLLSTVPQKAGGTADVQKCVPKLSEKAALSKTKADSGVILSTEEIKVTTGPANGEVKISVPCFLGQKGKKKLGAPPGLESGRKPPGIHFAPPPGLSRQPMKVTEPDLSSSLSGLPPPFPTSPASASPSSTEDEDEIQHLPDKEAGLSDGDNSTADDEQQAQADTDICKPLPTLLGSTPLPSLLGSAPLYGKSIIDKFTNASKADKMEPARVTEVTPS